MVVIREVIFPADKERKEIEREILKRPVKVGMGTHMIERLTLAQPMISTKKGLLSRSWIPGETAKDIREQNKSMKGGK